MGQQVTIFLVSSQITDIKVRVSEPCHKVWNQATLKQHQIKPEKSIGIK
jgi:hypothetical protein